VLANDIDLEGVAILPIGNSSKGFTGEFYGQNHCISNYVVNATTQCAGLFGNIAGGRVEGVQAFGTVGSSGSYVGGFAGKIGSRSLVKGCSFVGAVSSTSTQVGGFAGYMSDSPSVAECCAVGAVSKTSGTGSGYVGGFVGQQSNGGFIADSYARVAVDAGAAGYAGGFAGGTTGAKIVRAYCSGGVSSTAPNNYVGAFGGNMTAGVVTNAYYDADATTQLAAGKYNAAAIAYAGITGLSSNQMLHAANFAFDFLDTWRIDEGETAPYLQTFLVVIEPATIEPLDVGASEADVRTQTARFTDPGLDETIGGSVEKWNDFAEWANGMIGDADAVLANTHVAAAFLLGASALLENEPEVRIDDVEVADVNGETSVTLTVTVKDGESPVEVAAAKVAALFEATTDLNDWTSPAKKLEPHAEPVGGDGTAVRIRVTPGDGTASRAFLRIRK